MPSSTVIAHVACMGKFNVQGSRQQGQRRHRHRCLSATQLLMARDPIYQVQEFTVAKINVSAQCAN